MLPAEDEDAIQELAAQGAFQAFADRFHARRDGGPITAACCTRPGPITVPAAPPGSRSSAGPSLAASSANTSEPRRRAWSRPLAGFWNPTAAVGG
jgi:hypothetical protein